MPCTPNPKRLTLKKDQQLEIQWQDGQVSIYPIAYLRQQCPCAQCRQQRAEQQAAKGKVRLQVLSRAPTGPVVITDAQRVGNYAIRLVWSDGHDTGIYSYHYLHQISPAA